MNPLNRKILRDLWRIKGQALAIALVIGSGVAMYVMALGALASLEETRNVYYERYRFADVFVPLKRAPETFKHAVAAVPGIKSVETRIKKFVTIDVPGLAEPATAELVSLPAGKEPLLNLLHLREGRLPEVTRPDEVVVGEAFAIAHGFHPGDGFAAIINGKKRQLNIVGVALSPEYIYALGPGSIVPDDKRFGIVWMGRKALEAAFDMDGAFTNIAASLERTANVDAVLADLDRMTARYGGIRAVARKDQVSHWFISNEIAQLRTMASVLTPMFLGVAVFLLHIVVSRLVDTEREQIGLLKAFGYTNADVAWLYIKFVMVMVGLGILAGFGFGTWLGRGMTQIYADFFRFPFLYYIYDGATYATAALISVAVGAVGVLGAVRRAVALMPAEAMVPPPPTSYRPAWVERVLGLRRLSEVSRMILRHTLRWPVRSGLTVLGISLAVSLLISTMFFFDAMDRMMEVHFFQAQRQDVTVRFTDARAVEAAREISRLPGVLAVEPYRAVPVRLVAGHRARYEDVLGFVPGADLMRALNRDLSAAALPSEGLALSQKLADLLAVGVGDAVTVEVKEGRRAVREIRVAAIVGGYLGTPAYMDKTALHGFMDEDPVANGVSLVVDSAAAAALYARLKEMPDVAGVGIQGVMLQSFRDTIQESMGLMVSFNVLFACIVAFGVVYNAARITLSERARELASLRVLGFTRGEVATILIGELALLCMVALPLGAVLGYAQAGLWVVAFDTEMFRIPLVVDRATYGFSLGVVLAAALVSAAVVRRRLDALDLVMALKTRE